MDTIPNFSVFLENTQQIGKPPPVPSPDTRPEDPHER